MADLTEFKGLVQQWETQANNVTGETAQKLFRLAAFQLAETIIEVEKRYREESATVDFGEPLPGILQKQVDFGEEEFKELDKDREEG